MKHETPQTIRFWALHFDGWIRFSLRDGEEVSFSEGGRHEEGHSYTYTTYSREGETVHCVEATESQDCDGRHSDCWAGLFQLKNLRANWNPDNQIHTPQWGTATREQRDYAAEAAGY